MSWTNAQILAAVVSEWARPAISQIAASRLTQLPIVISMEQGIKSSGIVSSGYKISTDIMPFMQNGMTFLVQPLLEQYFSQIPDASIPQLARSVVDTAMQQPKFSILDGFIEFEQSDIQELSVLLDKNLPVNNNINNYQVKK